MRNHLTTRQLRLLEALVRDPNVLKACESVEVSRATAYRWMEEPTFKAELERQRDAVLTTAMAGVKAQSVRAAEELAGLLGTKDERLRRMVCNDVLTRSMKVREMEEFERRLVAVENSLIKDAKQEGEL